MALRYLGEIIEDIEMIVEETGPNKEKTYWLRGVYTEADQINKNKRIYPYNVLQKEVKRFNEDAISKNRAVGELGHPENISINLDRVSHLVTELKEDGKQFIGKAKILGTPMGLICKNFIDEGVKIGMSSRAAGSLENSQHGADVVGDDLHIVSFDAVHDPSCAAAMVEGIMESKSFYFDKGILKEKHYDKVQKAVKKLSKVEMDEGALLKIFEKIIDSI